MYFFCFLEKNCFVNFLVLWKILFLFTFHFSSKSVRQVVIGCCSSEWLIDEKVTSASQVGLPDQWRWCRWGRCRRWAAACHPRRCTSDRRWHQQSDATLRRTVSEFYLRRHPPTGKPNSRSLQQNTKRHRHADSGLCLSLYIGYNTVWNELCECIRANSLQSVVTYLFHDCERSLWLFCLVSKHQSTIHLDWQLEGYQFCACAQCLMN